ncbi:hypothetical protein HGA88_07030 [Candidatus Roizmanbacteria bacterium]|nr:hypothetical protein [Candidatus Roizmanbacteria bacterium]
MWALEKNSAEAVIQELLNTGRKAIQIDVSLHDKLIERKLTNIFGRGIRIGIQVRHGETNYDVSDLRGLINTFQGLALEIHHLLPIGNAATHPETDRMRLDKLLGYSFAKNVGMYLVPAGGDTEAWHNHETIYFPYRGDAGRLGNRAMDTQALYEEIVRFYAREPEQQYCPESNYFPYFPAYLHAAFVSGIQINPDPYYVLTAERHPLNESTKKVFSELAQRYYTALSAMTNEPIDSILEAVKQAILLNMTQNLSSSSAGKDRLIGNNFFTKIATKVPRLTQEFAKIIADDLIAVPLENTEFAPSPISMERESMVISRFCKKLLEKDYLELKENLDLLGFSIRLSPSVHLVSHL